MSNSLRVRSGIGPLEDRLSKSARRIWDAPDFRELYPAYLVALHTMVRAGVPLMEAALEQVLRTRPADPVHAELEHYLRDHIFEETGHDEWLLEDLEAVGVPRSRALDALPGRVVAELVGAQYYFIRHYDPVCLLGYFATIEGYPPAEDAARDAAERSGYPPEAFHTIRRHANLAPFHKGALDELLDSLPLTERQLAAVNLNAVMTMEAVIEFLDAVRPEPSA